MLRTSKTIIMLGAIAIGSVLFFACTEMTSPMDTSTYQIKLPSPKHFHAFTTTDTLFFQVLNQNDEPKAGLTPTVTWALKGSSVTNETGAGDVVDNHNGTYYWVNTFAGAGFYTLTFSFENRGMTYSQSFPFEATYAGGERIFCPDTINPAYNYQVRWNAIPGTLYGGDSVEFLVEIKRSISSPVNTTQPWLNKFDHLSPQDLVPSSAMPVIKVGSAMGEHDMTVSYKGLGVYSAKAVLMGVSAMETSWLHVSFADSCGQIDEDGSADKNYQFPVMPAGMTH